MAQQKSFIFIYLLLYHFAWQFHEKLLNVIFGFFGIYETIIVIITNAAFRQFRYYKLQHCVTIIKIKVQTHNLAGNSMPLP